MTVETITTNELKKQKNNIQLVDVLPEEFYNKKHIPGAVNIPLEDLTDRADKELDKNQKVVVYCKDKECGASPKAYKLLDGMGYDVVDYEPGVEGRAEEGNEIHEHGH